MLQETLQHVIPGGIHYCNVTIGAVLSWKPRIIRLQLQFFFRIPGGINYCNVTLRFYMILSFRNIICNNFVPNGKQMAEVAIKTNARSMQMPEGAMKQTLVQGRSLGLPGRSWKLEYQEHPEPENRDSQHKLNQPTGFLKTLSLPDLLFLAFWKRQGNPPKKNKDFVSLPNPPNSWERRKERSKVKEFPAKKRNSKKTRNGRSDPDRAEKSLLSIRGMSEIPTTATSQKVRRYISNSYCNTPPIYIPVLAVSLSPVEKEILSVLLPSVSQYASHLNRNAFGKALVLWIFRMFPS